jgi:hypothetical protein
MIYIQNMKIIYYTIPDYHCIYLPKELNVNFVSKELALAAIQKYYQFNPSPSCKFESNYLKTYKPIVEKIPIYKVYKSGPKRGGIVQKDGKDVIIDYNEHSYSIVDQDFSSFNIKKHSFLDRSPYLYDEKYSGYYELKTDNFITEIKESSVNYKCQAFVRFVEAIIENTPEVKEVGKPYQAPKKELKIIKESEWFPVYKCSKYSKNDYICGIDNNMDNWARTELLFIESEIFVREEELEMVESL